MTSICRFPGGLLGRLSSGFAALVMAALQIGGAAGEAPAPSCDGADGQARVVTAVTAVNSLVLDDGRDVRLAGLLFPSPPPAVLPTAAVWPPAIEAHQSLVALSVPVNVLVSQAASGVDRYGRPSAKISLAGTGNAVWLQKVLVEQGHAIVSSRSGGETACLRQLLEVEGQARSAKRGLWANAHYNALPAVETHRLLALRSQFALVEGKVAGVVSRAGRMYLNFGDDWKTDFTIVVPKSLVSSEPDEVQRLNGLKDRQVRVRGWVERRYGPSIEIFNFADIELMDNPAAAP